MKKIFLLAAVAALSINAAELKVDYSGKDKTAHKNFNSALKVAQTSPVLYREAEKLLSSLEKK